MRTLVISIFSSFLFLILGLNIQANAQATPTGTCQPIFGGGETCKSSGNLLINKTIKNPASNSFVESLPHDVTFKPDQELTFQISVTNNNNSEIKNITITDFLPQYLSFKGGAGNFNTAKRELLITLDALKGNETKSYIFVAKTAARDSLPQGSNTTCLANRAEVKAGTRNSKDNVQFCISKDTQGTASSTQNGFPTPSAQAQPQQQVVTKPTQPVTTKGGQTIHPAPTSQKSPATGPELLGLIGLLPAAGVGFYLRKKTLFK